MSCTVFALPYAIAWVVGAVFANVPYSEIALDNEGMNNIDFSGDIDLPTVCDDVNNLFIFKNIRNFIINNSGKKL